MTRGFGAVSPAIGKLLRATRRRALRCGAFPPGAERSSLRCAIPNLSRQRTMSVNCANASSIRRRRDVADRAKPTDD